MSVFSICLHAWWGWVGVDGDSALLTSEPARPAPQQPPGLPAVLPFGRRQTCIDGDTQSDTATRRVGLRVPAAPWYLGSRRQVVDTVRHSHLHSESHTAMRSSGSPRVPQTVMPSLRVTPTYAQGQAPAPELPTLTQHPPSRCRHRLNKYSLRGCSV